jgi:hypothetical protein
MAAAPEKKLATMPTERQRQIDERMIGQCTYEVTWGDKKYKGPETTRWAGRRTGILVQGHVTMDGKRSNYVLLMGSDARGEEKKMLRQVRALGKEAAALRAKRALGRSINEGSRLGPFVTRVCPPRSALHVPCGTPSESASRWAKAEGTARDRNLG